jgi:hypothetical protein
VGTKPKPKPKTKPKPPVGAIPDAPPASNPLP